MITEKQYTEAKKIVEEYEHQEYVNASIECIFCVECQALDAHDCFCSDEPIYCSFCMQEEPSHDEECKLWYNPNHND